MWNNVIMALGAATLAGCQPSTEPTVWVEQVSPSIHNVFVETPHWDKRPAQLPKADAVMERDGRLANDQATALCESGYSIEIVERRVDPCDWVCEGYPPYTTATQWLVSCKSASE